MPPQEQPNLEDRIRELKKKLDKALQKQKEEKLDEAEREQDELQRQKNKPRYYSIDDFIQGEIVAPYVDRGYTKFKQNDFEGAMQDYSEAIKLNPSYAKAYAYRGILKERKHDYHGAIQDYTKAIELNPTSDIANLLYFERGVAKFILLDFKGAISDFSKAIDLNPENHDAYSFRGCAKLKLWMLGGMNGLDMIVSAREDTETGFNLWRMKQKEYK